MIETFEEVYDEMVDNGEVKRDDCYNDDVVASVSDPLWREGGVTVHEFRINVKGASESREDGQVYVKEVEFIAEDIEAAVDEEGDEGGFDKVEERDDDYLPLHFIEAVLMPSHSHKLLHD